LKIKLSFETNRKNKMFSENILVFILAMVDFVLSSVSTDVSVDAVVGTGQLWKTLYSALLEELRGAHLRIAATNVSKKSYYIMFAFFKKKRVEFENCSTITIIFIVNSSLLQ